ncbi:ead/Ea22-like family protein [Klebsiella michiganensis]|nr:ead/Ea22-like family protein [Klebsiella michiganensis]MBA8302529.1 ead/Ea22-like family protein [Klebsiella michiganensis]QLP33953.1 ead/Ea22-like family protein [Klebsiella michiganensis]WFX45903.1 ead/Ea22-like family protein [Klebsiella michiganensis]WFX51567.1 ead/Ea22-like family protein [Klebsiella michiganensis]
MTTDITELAQSLKAAANKAGADDWQAKKISGEFYVIRKGSYSSKCGYRTYQPIAEIDHKSTRDYVAIASPANILALVEALEKAQATEAHCNRGWREAHEQEARSEAVEKRIAELESRSVKLPSELELRNNEVCSVCAGNALQVIEDKLTAAGIKWEAE